MTRTIRLSRIHALNWYGYQDSLTVEGNLLLAGVTGSGKSILMDLIQFVLVGDQRAVRFNQSATGDRSDRTLKGYCLGTPSRKRAASPNTCGRARSRMWRWSSPGRVGGSRGWRRGAFGSSLRAPRKPRGG